MRAAQIAKPGIATTKNITWERLRATRLSNLTCPLVEGSDMGREVIPYILTIHYADTKYVIYIAEDASIAQPCDPKFDTLSSVVPPTLTPFPTSTTAPTLEFTSTPTLTPTLEATLTPSSTPTPVPTATPLPAAFTCPPDFNGFMQPRLRLGRATARVGMGGSPNRLRTEPSVSGEQVGQIQPGRTINQVLGGPACSGTYVWWRVEMEGVEGWTVESDSSDGGSYFLEPLEAPPLVEYVTLEPTATPTMELFVPEALHAIQLLDPLYPEKLRFLSDDTVAIQSTTNLSLWMLTDRTGTLQTIENNVVASADTQDVLYGVPLGEEVLVKVNKADPTTVTVIPFEGLGRPSIYFPSSLSMTRDGHYLVVGGCANEEWECQQGTINLWDVVTQTLIRKQPAHSSLPLAWFTPDETRILSMGSDGFQVWDVHTGAFVSSVAIPLVFPYYSWPVISPDSSTYYIVACAERVQGETVAICKDGEMVLHGWSMETGEEVVRVSLAAQPWKNGGLNGLYALAVSPDGRTLATAAWDPRIVFWSIDPVTHAIVEGQTLDMRTSEGPSRDYVVSALAFSPDGTQIAVGMFTRTVQILPVPQP